MAKKAESSAKEHKHLFGTSEKSDFIVNMTADGAQKMCGVYGMISVLIIALAAVPAYFTQAVVDYTDEQAGTVHYLSENFIFYSAAAVMLFGIIGFLIYMIACSKKIVSLKDNKALIALLGVMILSAAACFAAYDIHVAALGYIGRHDGLLTILGCYGLFCVAMAVTAEKWRLKLTDLIVGIGLVQSIAGILQAVPATSGAMKNFFEYLYIRPGLATSEMSAGEVYYDGGLTGIFGIYSHGRAASGFMTSPHALAAVLSAAFALALAALAFDGSKVRKIFCGISAPVMAAAACLSRVLPAVIGIGAGAAVVLVIAVIRAVKGGKSSLICALVGIAVSGAAAGILFGTGAADLRDEQVIFTDGFVMRSLTYSFREDTEDDIYTYLRKDAEYIAGQNPLLGVGLDNQPYCMSEYGADTDRYYNEYLDIAVTRGVPCLIVYGIFLLISVIKAVKSVGQFAKTGENAVCAGAAAAMAAYLAQAFFNTTWALSAPYLFIAVGLIWSYGAVKDSGKKKK